MPLPKTLPALSPSLPALIRTGAVVIVFGVGLSSLSALGSLLHPMSAAADAGDAAALREHAAATPLLASLFDAAACFVGALLALLVAPYACVQRALC